MLTKNEHASKNEQKLLVHTKKKYIRTYKERRLADTKKKEQGRKKKRIKGYSKKGYQYIVSNIYIVWVEYDLARDFYTKKKPSKKAPGSLCAVLSVVMYNSVSMYHVACFVNPEPLQAA